MAKIISIITTVTLVAIGFWITAKPWVESPVKFADWRIWIVPLIMLTLLGALIAVAFMILPDRRWKFLTSALVAVTSVLVFGLHYFNIIAAGGVVLFHWFGIRVIEQESEERLKIHPRRTIYVGIAEVMIPLYIVLSFAYFATPAIQQASQRDVPLPHTIKQAVSGVALQRAYDLIIYWAEPYREYFPPVLAFGLFLVLWGLGFVLHRVATMIGVLLMLVLRKTKFILITEKMISREQISLWPPTTTKP